MQINDMITWECPVCGHYNRIAGLEMGKESKTDKCRACENIVAIIAVFKTEACFEYFRAVHYDPKTNKYKNGKSVHIVDRTVDHGQEVFYGTRRQEKKWFEGRQKEKKATP